LGFIIVGILLLLSAGVVGLLRRAAKKSADPDAPAFIKATPYIIGALLGLFVLFTVVSSYNTVPVGNVGLVYTFGNITGQTPSGLQWVAPWSSVTAANVKTQKAPFHLASFTKETQDVFVDATLNYQVAPKDIQTLYRNVGSNWFDVLVPTRINQAFKDETVKFDAVNIAPNRDKIRADVLARLKQELALFSIQVDDLNIDNIAFSPAFTKAIEDKQIATQEAAAAKNRVAQATAQAQAIVQTAEGQAKANQLKQRTLTPLLVEQNAIDKLNPNVQVIMVPSNSSFLLPNLLNTTPTPAGH
jgi:regulator of protease activity HflC (stomatin/prohibitin superfamily)